jgi:uncharacterized membrane protein
MDNSKRIRKIVVAGVLGAVSAVLGATIGFTPVPTPAGAVTFMHIPAIIGGVLEGPVVGAFVGLIFGIFSIISPAVPVKDPLVVVLPRLFIGVTAWAVYIGLKRINEVVALAVAAVVGSLTNTVLVLGTALLLIQIGWLVFPLTPAAALSVAVVQGLPEAAVAAIIVVAVVLAYKGIAGRGRRAHSDL